MHAASLACTHRSFDRANEPRPMNPASMRSEPSQRGVGALDVVVLVLMVMVERGDARE